MFDVRYDDDFILRVVDFDVIDSIKYDVEMNS
jgi:hypothetical protein